MIHSRPRSPQWPALLHAAFRYTGVPWSARLWAGDWVSAYIGIGFKKPPFWRAGHQQKHQVTLEIGLSIVNHQPGHNPETTPPCPETGKRSAFSFDSPAFTVVAQTMGSLGSKPSPEVAWNHTHQKNNLTTYCNVSVRRTADVPSSPSVESILCYGII